MRAVALRYALAPACILLAVLLCVSLSSAGLMLSPTGVFVIAVLVAAWFGGTGPGFVAAALATLALPPLTAMSYPLLGGFLDLPRLIMFSIAGIAVGWGSSQRRRVEAALREQERYARAMGASDDGFWDWLPAEDTVHISPRLLEIYGFAPGTKFAGREDLLARVPFHPEDRAPLVRAISDHFAGKTARFDIETRFVRDGQTRWVHLTGVTARDASGAVVRWTGTVRDVTERKRAEQALRNSEQRYALAMEAAGDGHTDWDLVTGEFYISPRLLEIVGHPPDASFANRADWVRRFPFHPEDRPKWEAAAAAHFAGRESHFKMELRIVVRGEVRWTAFHFLSTRDAAGEPIRWTGSIGDITEQKRVEEALRASEERYSLAMEAAEEGYVDSDVETDQFVTSERLNEIFGVPPGTRFADRSDFLRYFRFHGDDGKTYADTLRAVATRGGPDRYEFEFRIVLPSGEVRWLWTRGKVTRDAEGRARRRVGVVADITARKLAEEALRTSEDRFARAVAGSYDGVWDIDFAARSVFLSARTRELCGLPPGPEVVPLDGWFEALPLHPEDKPRRFAAVEAHLSGKAPAYEGEFRLRQPDGVYRWRHLHGVCVRDADGKPLRMAGSISDVDDRRRAEDALRESEGRYERVMAATEAGFWDWDILQDKYYVSPRLLEMAGLPADTIIAGRADFQARVPLHPEDLAKWQRDIQALFASGGSRLSAEVRVILGSGTRWYRLDGMCFRNAAGSVVRWTGSAIDVTPRKVAEDALRASEERYSLAMEGSQDGHFDVNADTDELYTSERLNEIYGFPSGTRFAKRAEYLAKLRLHPDDVEMYHTKVAAIMAKDGPDRFEFEFRIVWPSGEVRWLRTRGKVTRDGEGHARRRTGTVADITDATLAEAGLRASEQRYQLAMEVAEEGHFDWNVQSDEIFLSAQHLMVIGVPPEAEYRTRSDVMARVRYHPDDGPRISAEWDAALADRGADYQFEYRVLRGEEPRWIHARWKIFRDAHGVAQRVIGVVSDITERKRAEGEVRESEARKSAMFETALDCIVSIDHEGRVVEFNPAAEHTFGYRRAEVLGKELAALIIPPRLRAQHRQGLARYLTSGQGPVLGRRTEMPAVRADGSEFPVELAVTRIATQGAPLFTAYLRDITERKRIEEALRESEQRYELAMAASESGYWDWEIPAGRYFVSPKAYELGGYEPGLTWADRDDFKAHTNMHPQDFAKWEAAREELFAGTGERLAMEVRYIVRGETRWHLLTAICRRDETGKVIRWSGSATDVTARKLAEEALRLSEERHALAVASADEGIFDWDLLSDRVYVSQRAQELFGLPVGELWHPRREWRRMLNFHPEDTKLQHDSIKALIAGETSTYDVEFRIILPDGSHRWFRQRAIALRDAAGKAYRMVGSIGDVTDRKRTQEELQRLELQLRQAQRLEAMGTLAGGIAHDFNNILGAILGYGEMAQRDAAKGSRLARDLDSIIVAGERGRALVDRVLAFSRSAVGERVAVDVEKVIREALDLVAARLPPSITLHAKLRAGRSAILGDATQVHQVLMNLSTNAIQAMPDGGTLRVSLDVSRMDASQVPTIGVLASASDYLVLRVADTGIGIAPDILERIFDPFFTTKEVGTGTGLGLSLVHGIVTELGGAIDVASTPGAGSTFTVYLPRSGEAVDARQDEEPEMPRGDGQRVLIVDDEEPLVRLATRTLEELGYAPVGFTSSSAALAALRADPQRFDAVITDERMPGMSGTALIREVRGIRDRIPIVLMSGYVGARVSSRAREAGAEEVLKKPLSARDLATSLARVLQL